MFQCLSNGKTHQVHNVLIQGREYYCNILITVKRSEKW